MIRREAVGHRPPAGSSQSAAHAKALNAPDKKMRADGADSVATTTPRTTPRTRLRQCEDAAEIDRRGPRQPRSRGSENDADGKPGYRWIRMPPMGSQCHRRCRRRRRRGEASGVLAGWKSSRVAAFLNRGGAPA